MFALVAAAMAVAAGSFRAASHMNRVGSGLYVATYDW